MASCSTRSIKDGILAIPKGIKTAGKAITGGKKKGGYDKMR